MDFEKALQKLLYGKKVRREIWDSSKNTQWMESNGDRIRLKFYDEETKQVTTLKDWASSESVFSLDDVTAEDWVVCNK